LKQVGSSACTLAARITSFGWIKSIWLSKSFYKKGATSCAVHGSFVKRGMKSSSAIWVRTSRSKYMLKAVWIGWKVICVKIYSEIQLRRTANSKNRTKMTVWCTWLGIYYVMPAMSTSMSCYLNGSRWSWLFLINCKIIVAPFYASPVSSEVSKPHAAWTTWT
jgi:hypothetical protein